MSKKEFDFERAVERLKRPFAFRDLEWVSNFSYGDSYNKAVIAVAPYVRRESIITRFNIVCGKGNWKNELITLGNAGLYQAILLRYGDEWIPNWDGAAMDTASNIDMVKSVSSKSLRRAAEQWDVGLYTQFVPQLYAIKRPQDEWDSYDKFSKKSWDFTVRWDRPVLPKEFLPKYMTPEQFRRMQRLIKYLEDDSEAKFQEVIDSWEEDCDSVSYEKAERLIDFVDSKIQKRLDNINPTIVHENNPNINSGNGKGNGSGVSTNKKNKSPKNKGNTRSKQSPKSQNKGSQKQSQSQKKGINEKQMQQLISNISKFDEDDPQGVFLDRDWLQEIKTNVKKHKSGKHNYLISPEQFQDWMQRMVDAMDDMDDLPF